SSTWPDEIRRKGNKYDHPDWHFIDYPLRPPSFPIEPDARPTNNVVFGIAQCEKTLNKPNADPELRAVYLSYLVHLVGDLHQPLHCASLFTDAYPKGDKGGNDFFVRPNKTGVRLHGIWDGLLGSSANPRTQWNYAIELEAKSPRKSLPELKQHKTPKEWSFESRQLAIDIGYQRGELKGGTMKETAVDLPAGYTKTAKAVAEKQGALAGYRLADEIEKYLKLNKTVSLLPENTNPIAKELPPSKIGATEAAKHYDQSMIVTGIVAQVTVRPTTTLINLDVSGRDAPFTAVIFEENSDQFPDPANLKGKNVEISGMISEFHGKPEIVLESADQIKVSK
ncbi:MAG TPA: S1/P1 nuclease, partial [Verrucomicrobiae bacterium]|nr:S1/P1 nuclease [Verrucomicrobiae bacterium]